MGPGSKDGYIHIDDARELLRIEDGAISEIVIRCRDLSELDDVNDLLNSTIGEFTNPMGKKPFEIHTWMDLSPFANMAKMIDLLTLCFKIILIAIVLVSIMNVMVMAVYERIREIGTIAAIGTKPGKILALFISEGLLLGGIGTILGTVISLIIIYILNIYKITFSFARKENLLLEPSLQTTDILTICAVVIAVAVIASFQPAWKASRMDPITALRHV
jgi:putative ABC transport system permease protein